MIERKILNLETGFKAFFTSKGYILHDQEPLLPTDDTTIAFTNATIVPLKKYLFPKSTLPYPGFVIVQPCLRLRNLASRDYSGQFTSYFKMASILVHPTTPLEKLTNIITEYLLDTLQFNKKQMRIQFNDATEDLAAYWPAFSSDKNIHSQSYYSWKYGVEGVTGRGITFCIETGAGVRELGNFVEMKKGNRIIGYEFGFGIESCLSILENARDNFAVLFGSSANRKQHDLACASMVIHDALRQAQRKVHGTAVSSRKKVDHELIQEVVAAGVTDFSFMYSMQWKHFGLSKESIDETVQTLNKKLQKTRGENDAFIAYRFYLATMRSLGRSEEWETQKLREYVRKRNLPQETHAEI